MRKFRKHVQLNKRRIYNFLTCVKKLPDTCKIYTHNIDTKIVSVYNIYIYNDNGELINTVAWDKPITGAKKLNNDYALIWDADGSHIFALS